METFGEWLNAEVEERGWSFRELSRRAGVSQSAISLVLSGEPPGPKSCRGIARALNLPVEEVFRRAGILPPSTEKTPSLRELDHLFTQLTPEQQDDVLTFVRALLEKRKQRRHARTTPKPST